MLQDIFEESIERDIKHSTFSKEEVQALKEELARISVDGDKLCIFVNSDELFLKRYDGKCLQNIEAKRVARNYNIVAMWLQNNEHTGIASEHRLVMENVTLNRSFDNETILGNDCAIWSSLDFSKERERMLEERKMERNEFELER